MEEAKREGYVSDFIIYNLAVQLNLADQLQYQKLSDLMNNMFARFGHDFELVKFCSAGKAKGGDLACKRYAHTMGWVATDGKTHPWSPENIAKYAAQWGRAVRERKKLLYNATAKLDVAELILNKFSDLKAITFAESTNFADELTKRLGTTARSYHSNLESEKRTYAKTTVYKTKPPKTVTKIKSVSGATRRKEALEALNAGGTGVRVINTARALDEGFDVADIGLALVCSSTSAPRQDTQRSGRAIRFVFGKMALVVNLYIPGTQDEKWLRARQKNARRIEWISSVDEISHERPTTKGFSLVG